MRKIERWQRIFCCLCVETFGAAIHTEGRGKANLIIKDAFDPWSRKCHNGFISFQIEATVTALCAKDVDSFIYPCLAPKQRILWTHFHSTTCGLGRKFCQQEPGIEAAAERLCAQVIETATRTPAKWGRMTNDLALEKYRELQATYLERGEAAKRIAVLDMRIAELMDMTSQSQTRKTKTFSPKIFPGGAEFRGRA